MNGKEVYKFAVTTLPRAAKEAVARAGIPLDAIDLFIPHQANVRIINSAAEALGIPPDKVFTNVERYGNTSAASIPLAVCDAFDEGRLQPGQKVLLAGFGGGLSWGATVIDWTAAVPQAVTPRTALLHSLRDRVAGTRSLARKTVRRVDSLLLDARWNGGVDPRTGNSLDAPPAPAEERP
jgi:3-oxoacyl-[acyl-carrier-protein] synthase-3